MNDENLDELKELLNSVTKADYSEEGPKIQSVKAFLEKERTAYLEMDRQFTMFLKIYVEKYKQREEKREKLKNSFFKISVLLLVLAVLTPIVFIVLLIWLKLSDSGIVSVAIGVFAEVLATIIILPKIIAEYLFDKEEGKELINVIENMQKYNSDKHNYLEKDKDKK